MPVRFEHNFFVFAFSRRRSKPPNQNVKRKVYCRRFRFWGSVFKNTSDAFFFCVFDEFGANAIWIL